VPKTLVESTNGSLMRNAHTTAGHQTATERLMSKAAATAEAAAEAAGMPAAEAAAAAAMATAATATATATAARFGDAGRGSNDDRRSKCGFDCEC
jgi:hypothetical protein